MQEQKYLEFWGKRIRLPEGRGEGEKRTRLRSPSPSPQQGVKPKDVCVCVRLQFDNEDGTACAKWLRLKIPGAFIEEFEITKHEHESEMDEDSDVSSTEYDPSPDSTEYEPSPDILRSWTNIKCRVDPVNGPFDFTPLVKEKYCYPLFASCAALGSVIYALGGDLVNIGDRRLDYSNDAAGLDITHPGIQPPPQRTITGPPVCGGRPLLSTSITSSNVDTCHRFHFCDFSKESPHWQVSSSPLIAPRYSAKLLTFDGKIYAFGGTHPTDEEAPFVEVYDPDSGRWEAISNPPFGRLSTSELFVFPLPNSSDILVLGTYSHISYKLNTLSCMWYPFDGCTGLGRRLFGKIKRNSSPVIFDDTTYWIHRDGALCAYRLSKDQGEGKYYEGVITGFENLQIDIQLKETLGFPFALLPISRHLLGLFWCSIAPAAFGHYYGSCLHISLLRVSLEREFELYDNLEDYPESPGSVESPGSTDPSLTASVVTSLTFPFPMDSVNIVDAHLIDDEDCRKLVSSCTDVKA